ncbi:hypothetical protein V7S43_003930 [Phytophthora oleae]|uniref:BZIP domain-containing protein n=1 Tax=Phytophthora oleae TaxID=2107226 RepID=A0ABD3FUY1_9STRA
MESSGGAPKGECPTCSKLVAESNMAKHHKVCGKKKPRKTCKAINRDSYARNKAKISKKRQEKRAYDQFRRLELAREQLATLASQPLEVDQVEEPSWEPLASTNLLHGVSVNLDLFMHFLNESKARCKKRHGLGPRSL